MPTILTKRSNTPGAVPATANLTNAAGGAELAVNTADKRLFSINSSSAIIEVGTNPSSLTCADASFTVARVGSLTISSLSLTNVTVTSATVTTLTGTSANITNISGTSLTVSTATLSGGTANGVLYLNGSKVATSGSALVFTGTNLGIGNNATNARLEVTASTGEVFRADASGGAFRIVADQSDVKLQGTSSVQGWVNGSEGFRLTSSTLYTASGINVGIGTSSPSGFLANKLVIATGGTANEGMTIYSSSNNGSIWFADATTGTGRYAGGFDYSHSDDTLIFYSATQGNMRLNASGNLGLGVTPSTSWFSSSKAIQIGSAGAPYMGLAQQTTTTCDGYMLWGARLSGDRAFQYTTTGDAVCAYRQNAGTHNWFTAGSGTAGNAISFTQAMTLDASGRLLVGTTSGAATITANASGGATIRALRESVSATNHIQMEHDGTNGKIAVSGANALIFDTNSGERARITSGGRVGINATAPGARLSVYGEGTTTSTYSLEAANSSGNTRFIVTDGGESNFYKSDNGLSVRITSGGEFYVGQTAGSINVNGAYITGAGQAGFCISGSTPILVNRKTDDGTLISFRQDDTEEGTISVSGNTVSYNAFAGSHWSQLQDGSKPDILRGTVMESINELCVWPDENNERLPKAKISDTAGSKKVYGVFMAWDNDWTTTNDMYVTAVGAFICRVNGSVTVQEGDLLESNGDGTARVQADDIIRSSTIGKVTSTVKTHQYADGSYCVPTVLYCG